MGGMSFARNIRSKQTEVEVTSSISSTLKRPPSKIEGHDTIFRSNQAWKLLLTESPKYPSVSVSVADLQKQMEKQCCYAVQDVALASDGVSSDALMLDHSNRIASVQKDCLSIAEEKLALAVQTYELVDSHMQQLDADYRKYEEERKREREPTGALYLDYNSDGWLQEVDTGSVGQRKYANLLLCKGHRAFVDPSEPRYCYCNRISYGEMIACDNPECRLEWFHFDCVGIKERPKGKWFCSECSNCKRRRGK